MTILDPRVPVVFSHLSDVEVEAVFAFLGGGK